VAVGSYHNEKDAFSEVWNGARWRIVKVPEPGGAISLGLGSVACSGPWACIAVGSYQKERGVTLTLAERWDGTSWSVQDTPNKGTLFSQLDGVSCATNSSCAAVGSYLGQSRNCQPPEICPLTLAESWDGATWAIQPTPPPPRRVFMFSLTGVSCTSPTACTAVGNRAFVGSPWMLPFAETWDGTAWSLQHMPPDCDSEQFIFMRSIACAAAATCTAVGSNSIKTFAEAE
jgi:hypothetical protein